MQNVEIFQLSGLILMSWCKQSTKPTANSSLLFVTLGTSTIYQIIVLIQFYEIYPALWAI